MFHVTGFTTRLILSIALVYCVTTETSVVTHNSTGPSCSLDNLPGQIIGCVNHETPLEVNTYAVHTDIQAECLIWYKNVSELYACRNYHWVSQSEHLTEGVDHKFTVSLRRHKRFLGSSLRSLLFGDDNDDTTRTCTCQWNAWMAWSYCTSSCLGTGGTKERRRKFDTRYGCMQSCRNSYGGTQITVCNSRCYKDGEIVADGNPENIQKVNQLKCECPLGTTGACCQAVSCETPSAISHGSFSGSWYTYGHSIQYSCDSGYYLNDPSLSVRTCTAYGVLSGQMPSCVYDSCSSGPCRNGAVCARRNGGYSCSCGQFWTGTNCEIDILPIVVSGCPSSRFIRVSNKTSVQRWNEPTFHDPRGYNVVVTKNYPVSSYEFPWGVYTVQYTAVKTSNGLSAECTFQITIQPHPCPKLPVPRHGLIACNGWQRDYAQVCKIYCIEGYSMPPWCRTDLIYSCGSSGSWRPATQVHECVRSGTFMTKKMPTFRECGLMNDDIRLQYITDLKHSQFNSLCMKNKEECTKNNVTISCP